MMVMWLLVYPQHAPLKYRAIKYLLRIQAGLGFHSKGRTLGLEQERSG